MTICFRAFLIGVMLFVPGFYACAQTEEGPQTPGLLSLPSLPSVESFEAPKPPGFAQNMAWIMPDVKHWRGDRAARGRVLNSSRALARMEETPFEAGDLVLRWPVHGKISSGFGWRGAGTGRDLHEGIDIPVPRGTPLQAALPGVVSEARVYNGYGKTVILDHGSEIMTLYAHCSDIAVKPGEYVEAGQVIAYAGNTGRSTTSHLHFGVIVAGVFRDPALLLEKEPPSFVRKP